MFAGMFYGFDIGNIGGVMTFPAFKHAFGFNDLTQTQLDGRKGDIAAMVAAGAAIGSLAGAPVADYWGRRIALLTYGIIFTAGAVMQEFPKLGVFLAGRFISGLGVGATRYDNRGAEVFLVQYYDHV